MRRLSALGSKSLAHRKGRSVLTGAGIALGVAILFGVLVANSSTQAGVEKLVEDFVGRADAYASPVGIFDADLPSGTVERLGELSGVTDVVGEFSFFTVLHDYPSPSDPDEPADIVVAGIVDEEARKVRDFDLAAGRMPAEGADELIVSETFANELGVGVGTSLEIRGAAEIRALEIVGVLEPTGAGSAAPFWARIGGYQTYTSLPVARLIAGMEPGVFQRASIFLADATDPVEWADANRDAIAGVRLEDSGSLAPGLRRFVELFGLFLAFFAGTTLFVGAFLIFLTLSMAVIERTRVYGSLRALGATQQQVWRVVLAEAGTLGVVSTLAGIGLGLLLAMGLVGVTAQIFALDISGVVVTAPSLALAVSVGVAVTLGSALIPAIRAGRLAPVEAMRGEFASQTKLGRAWMAGAVLFAAGIVTFNAGANNTFSGLGVILVLGGAVLLVPLLLRPLALLLGRLTNRLARGVGEVAVLHLTKERSRSAYTLGIVMVVFSMILAAGGLLLSIRGALDEVIDRQFGADLALFPGVPQSESLEGPLRNHTYVAEVTPMRFGAVTASARGLRRGVDVHTIDPATYFNVSGYLWKDGSDRVAQEALSAGGSILIADEVARVFGIGRSDELVLETTSGPLSFEVAAVFSPQFGATLIVAAIDDARQYLAAGNPMGYMIELEEGIEAGPGGRQLRDDFTEASLWVETAAESREQFRGRVALYFQLGYAVLSIATLVGLLGLANTLAMSVLQRYREIGILRAIGVTRSQVRRMVLVESATMTLAAFVLALPLGWVLVYLSTRGVYRAFGFTLDIVFPWTWVPFVAVLGTVIAVVAAIAPGRRAAKLEVVTALSYE